MNIDDETLRDLEDIAAERGFEKIITPTGVKSAPEVVPMEDWATDENISRLRHGFQYLGGVVLYYSENLKHGVSSQSIYLFNTIYRNQFGVHKAKLKAVPEREELNVEEPLAPPLVTAFRGNQVVSGMNAAGIEIIKQASRDMVPKPKVVEIKHNYIIDLEKQPELKAILLDALDRYNSSLKPGPPPPYTLSGDDVINVIQGHAWNSTKEKMYPSYNPIYKSYGFDKRTVQGAQLLARRAPPEVFGMYLDLLKEMIDCINKWALTHGSLAGQIGRIAKGFDVRKAVCNSVSVEGNYICPTYKREYHDINSSNFFSIQASNQYISTVMKKRAPFAKRPPNWTLFSEDLILLGDAVWAGNFPPNFRLVTINTSASAGPYYSDEKKLYTYAFDMVQATILLRKLREAQESVKGADLSNAFSVNLYQKVFDEYAGLSRPETKPKLEPIERAKVNKASRNYFGFNSFIQLPAAVLYENIYTSMVQPDGTRERIHKCPERPEIYSLMTWAAEHNGWQELLTTMGKQAFETGLSIAVYSDNLWILIYIGDEFLWLSLDGSSMECSLTRKDVAKFNGLVLHDYFGGKVSPGWVAYALHFHPTIVADAIGLLGSVQWQNVGQFSGTSGTAALNNYKMTMAANALEDLLRKKSSLWPLDISAKELRERLKSNLTSNEESNFRPLPAMKGEKRIPLSSLSVSGDGLNLKEDLYQPFLQLGIKLKIELVTVTNMFSWLLKPNDYVFDQSVTYTIPLDLLGKDAFVLQTLPMIMNSLPIFPVLCKDRLVRALCYNKLEARHDLADVAYGILRQVRYKALFLQGGWADPAIGAVVRHLLFTDRVIATAFSLEETAKQDALMLQELVESVAGEGGIPLHAALKETLMSVAVPSMYSVWAVYKDKLYADAIMLGIIRDRGPDEAMNFGDIGIILGVLSRAPEAFFAKLNQEQVNKIGEFFEAVNEGERGTAEEFKELLIKSKERVLAGVRAHSLEHVASFRVRTPARGLRTNGTDYTDQSSENFKFRDAFSEEADTKVTTVEMPVIKIVKVPPKVTGPELVTKGTPGQAFYLDNLDPFSESLLNDLMKLSRTLKGKDLVSETAKPYDLVSALGLKITLPDGKQGASANKARFEAFTLLQLFKDWYVDYCKELLLGSKITPFDPKVQLARTKEIKAQQEGMPVRTDNIVWKPENLHQDGVAVSKEEDLAIAYLEKRVDSSGIKVIKPGEKRSKSKTVDKDVKKESKGKEKVEPEVELKSKLVARSWADSMFTKYKEAPRVFAMGVVWAGFTRGDVAMTSKIIMGNTEHKFTPEQKTRCMLLLTSDVDMPLSVVPGVLALLSRKNALVKIMLSYFCSKTKPSNRDDLVANFSKFDRVVSQFSYTRIPGELAVYSNAYLAKYELPEIVLTNKILPNWDVSLSELIEVSNRGASATPSQEIILDWLSAFSKPA